MRFFTVVDPAAPSIEKRKSDASWAAPARLAFARNAVRVLRELHGADAEDGPVAHRNLTARAILVRHDGQPILTGFEWSKIPSDVSVASSGAPAGGWGPEAAPEVRAGGRHAAGQRSDVYSLCASLTDLFRERATRTGASGVVPRLVPEAGVAGAGRAVEPVQSGSMLRWRAGWRERAWQPGFRTVRSEGDRTTTRRPDGHLFACLSSEYGRRQLKARAFGSSIPHLDESSVAGVVLPRLDAARMDDLGRRAFAVRTARHDAIGKERAARALVEGWIEERAAA